ncbi:hypothetical protein [Hydrotalea sp.]|uniref:hypothetical protein n=1 Tax=Hydrotalea sp. TaxID=2881279 RepID=UPI0026351B8F|nr:hypothetical protein [Hydrotalea sp.]
MKQISYILFIFVCSHFPNRLMAANFDTLTAHKLLQLLAQQQVAVHPHFTTGTFPAYRTYHFNSPKADDNIFFTGLIVFTLQQLYPLVAQTDKVIIDSIVKRAKPAFNSFKNKTGRNTYNFWQTQPSIFFPNGGWLNWMNRLMALPDDMDDTVISLLALNTDSTTAQAVHNLMQLYTNLHNGKMIHNTKKLLKEFQAYSTWFGNKMPIDFDVCVLANVLYFVQYYQLPFSKADSAAVNVIKKSIEENYILKNAVIISPHYQRTPVILYHLARLMSLPGFHALDNYKSSLIQSAQNILMKPSTHYFDKIILASALLKWNQSIPHNFSIKIPPLHQFFTADNFVFFKANMGSILPLPFKNIFEKLGIGEFDYDAPAYNMVLLLEYLLLQEQYNQIQP